MKIQVIVICLFISLISSAQQIPLNKIIAPSELSTYLKKDIQQKLSPDGANISETTLAKYFRTKFSERYFFNWENTAQRFKQYDSIYPQMNAVHSERALDHINKYADSTQWVLPFNYLNGDPVNAYALRHLARQHKMVDIAFYYYFQSQNPQYLYYFTNQLNSLNAALAVNEFEKIEDGNGVYEAFRSGYRVLNWLEIHNLFLGESAYSDQDQLTTIATLLQHGAHLYATNPNFVPGNHQTRGMSALAMISILLRDFNGTDVWYNHSMKLLEEHLSKEINNDGFQFERSVHYHMSDISNYYFVYQLAKNSDIEINPFWEQKLKSLFTTLVKIAYPDKFAPVFQDDTNNPWAEKNDISGALTLGYLLFEDPEMGYFANTAVAPNMYWFLNEKQLKLLANIQQKQPNYSSLSFPTTGYYIMREGWETNDQMLAISAGLDKDKPDHQHGDMLGVQAMANGKVILPNYQVRYSLEDYGFFKNSMVKNVALVDDELQGKNYKSNKGGSGFGKFGLLPQPTVIAWDTNTQLDFFAGSHDGFENIGVNYSRQVINVANDFWIVKDNFNSEKPHNYKQVWQGHYTFENAPNLLRSTFDNAQGCDIYQLQKIDTITSSGTRGKQWTIATKNTTKDFSFVTVIFPYNGYANRILEFEENPTLKGWIVNAPTIKTEGSNAISLSKNNETYCFNIKKLMLNDTEIEFSAMSDIYVNSNETVLSIQSLSTSNIEVNIKKSPNCNTKIVLQPGEKYECKL